MIAKNLFFLTLLVLLGVGSTAGKSDQDGFRIVRRCKEDAGDDDHHHSDPWHNGGGHGDNDGHNSHHGHHGHKGHKEHPHGHKGHKGDGDHDGHKGHKGDGDHDGHKGHKGDGDHDGHKGEGGDHHHPGKPPHHPGGPGASSPFFVDGKHIPGVPFHVSDSYAGLLPITAAQNETRKLFFWWYPNEKRGVGDDDLVLWFNGGPGCSSLEGLLQENGPWVLPFNSTGVPVKNPYSWNKLSNVLWLESPVGTGLTEGTPDATGSAMSAAQTYGFLVEFMKAFPQLKNKKIHLTGESYAGKYIPYLANEMLFKHSKEENKANGINLQTISINDPSWASDIFMESMPVIEFAEKHQKALLINDSTLADIKTQGDAFGFTTFVQDNLHYPPKGFINAPANWTFDQFDPWGTVAGAAAAENPFCFNVYNVEQGCVSDPLGYPTAGTPLTANNFINNITGFREYIHADPNNTWLECKGPVFPNGDIDPLPADTSLMSSLIENMPAGRTIIQHGDLDILLISNGSALAIQNMTWHGKQGYQHKPKTQLIVDGEKAGLVHEERGLAFVQPSGSGHMIPQDKPKTAFKMLKYQLGQISKADLTLPV